MTKEKLIDFLVLAIEWGIAFFFLALLFGGLGIIIYRALTTW